MAEITDPQVIKFCNEKIRPLADLVYSSYYKSLSLTSDYENGKINELLSIWGSEDLVADGSETDGRTRLSRQDLEYEYKILFDFIAYLESEVAPGITRLSIISKSHVKEI